jgi:hypothetical protein
MSKNKTETKGYKALWNIIHTTPTRADIDKVVAAIGGHDDRLAAVHHVANVLYWLASSVERDCDQLSYEHGNQGDSKTETGRDHYMSQVWYAYDGQRMANYCARIEEAHERDDELEQERDSVQEEHDGEMTEEQRDDAMENI